MAFDTTAWFENPAPHIEEALGEGGRYLELGLPHVVSPEQIAYATDVAQALTRSVGNGGLVAMPEAETGTGKTRGYLIPALLHATATGGRVLIATYRIDLRSAIVEREGPGAAAVVEAMTGRRPSIAPLMARSHFASPSRSEGLADRIAQEKPLAAAALRAIAAWTRTCAELIHTSPKAAVAALAGTIDLWRREHPEMADQLPLEDLDQWRLDAVCSHDEHLAYEAFRSQAQDADCLVMTQAALVVGLKARSTFGDNRRIVGVVVDEADRLEDAARSVLERRSSLADLDRCRQSIFDVVNRDDIGISPGVRTRILDLAMDLPGLIAPVHAFCGETRSLRDREIGGSADQLVVKGDEPWLTHVAGAATALAKTAAAMRSTRIPALASVADDVTARASIHSEFVACAKDSDKRLGRTFLVFSPKRGFPSVLVAAKYGSRIVQRLWNPASYDETMSALTPATIFTSATLSQPGLRGAERLSDMSRMVGLDWTPERLQVDLSGQHAPKKYGRVERFVLAHPSAPMPPRRSGEDEDAAFEADAAAYGAHRAACIVEAADRPPVSGRKRILVLTTSWFDNDLIAGALPERLANQLIVRQRGQSLAEVLELFRASEDAILVTPGAGEGFDAPGLIGRVLIPRLPFSPPEDAFGLPLVWQTENGTKASSDVVRMMRRLKQMIGRAIRVSDDVAEIWILDPRFGLPSLVQRRELLTPARQAKPVYHHCVPARFRGVLDEAEVFSPAEPAKARRRAAGGRR